MRTPVDTKHDYATYDRSAVAPRPGDIYCTTETNIWPHRVLQIYMAEVFRCRKNLLQIDISRGASGRSSSAPPGAHNCDNCDQIQNWKECGRLLVKEGLRVVFGVQHELSRVKQQMKVSSQMLYGEPCGPELPLLSLVFQLVPVTVCCSSRTDAVSSATGWMTAHQDECQNGNGAKRGGGGQG
ncbi:hypothetical protein F2P81_007483 [Scophthalmus maximus]|uniref:Uncharacterized protein n=1 Tax=Scophthalmus maximus TaxID=52904 RepID=A0A6A4T4I1_SCOMX|nr:hypothetical protein F2P81_007483 [Scophthalmus maximus]